MHRPVKFGEDPSNRCPDTAILLLSKWRPSAMLDFKKIEIFTVDGIYNLKVRHHAEIGEDLWSVAEIRADNGSVGHGSNGSMNMDGSRGSVPVTH